MLHWQRAVGFYNALEIRGREQVTGCRLECRAETPEIGLAQGQSSRGSVPPEAAKQVRLPFRYEIERVAHMQSRDRAPRAFDLAGAAARKRNHRPMPALLDPRGEDADYALVPSRVEQAKAVALLRFDLLECLQRVVVHA